MDKKKIMYRVILRPAIFFAECELLAFLPPAHGTPAEIQHKHPALLQGGGVYVNNGKVSFTSTNIYGNTANGRSGGGVAINKVGLPSSGHSCVRLFRRPRLSKMLPRGSRSWTPKLVCRQDIARHLLSLQARHLLCQQT